MPAFGALSRGDRLLFILVLAVFGGVDAAYLTYEWYAHATASWCDIDPFWNCSKVRESSWSAIGGVPTATIGLAGFAILAALLLLGLALWRRRSRPASAADSEKPNDEESRGDGGSGPDEGSDRG